MARRSMQDDPQSEPNLSESIPRSLLMLSLPQTKGDPSLRWLIIDGRKLALSHGRGQIYSYRGIVLAVQYLWNKKTHRKLLVCVPVWMKTHEELEKHYLIELQKQLPDLVFYTPPDAKGASFIDALARAMDALIVTQLWPDTWSEPRKRIVEFFFRDDFILPEYQWGKDGPSLSTLLRLRKPKNISVQKLVQDLMLKWKHFSEILKEALEPSLSEEQGRDPRLVIIDGSNVAMSHGLNRFYSCLGIYLAVQYIWNKGYRNITVFVPKCRKNSICTVYGPEYLDILYKKGHLIFTPSLCYDDECIPYELTGNHFIAFLKGSEAVGKSTVLYFVPKTGQTLHPVLPLPVQEAVKTRGELCCGKIVKKILNSPPSWTTLPHDGSIQNLLILPLPKTEGDPSLRWLILDGRRLALSHGFGEIYSYRGIALAVQYLWNMGHRNLIVCVPEWMKTHEDLPYHETHYLTELDHLAIVYMPSEAMEASFMDALARKMGALIVTQVGPDTWSEPRPRTLQLTFMKDSFMLPDDPRGKNGQSLSTLLRLNSTREISVQKMVLELMVKWELFSKLLTEPPHHNLSEEPGCNTRLMIIDGSNVAMSHGLDTFYSCLGIYLAVQYFWEKGYRNITACVPNWRVKSRNSVYGHEYLDMLYKKGLLALTGSISYDDRLMLKEAKENNGLIVTNDKFRDLKKKKKKNKQKNKQKKKKKKKKNGSTL